MQMKNKTTINQSVLTFELFPLALISCRILLWREYGTIRCSLRLSICKKL